MKYYIYKIKSPSIYLLFLNFLLVQSCRILKLNQCFTFFTAGLNHTCPSCGISFSSVSTLSAHVTYYCSKRPNSRAENPVAPEPCNGRVMTPDLVLDPGVEELVK